MNPWLIGAAWLLLVSVILAVLHAAVERDGREQAAEETAARLEAWREMRSRAMDQRRAELNAISNAERETRR
jgi:hypothetical protein